MSDFVSSGLLQDAVVASIPLILAAHGELLIQLSGILNLALAGIFTLGASAAFVTTFSLGDGAASTLAGFGMGAVAGALVGLLFAYFVVTLRVHQVTAGLGIFMLSLGGSELLYRAVVGISTTSVRVPTISEVSIPGLSRIPFLGQVLFTQSLAVYLVVLAVPVIHYLLFHTPLGLRLRATGENPRGADALGVNVFRIRYLAVIVGSSLIGLAGAFFPLVLLGGFAPKTIQGLGWLALMIVIFGKWRPRNIVLGAFLFAYLLALQFSVALNVRSLPAQFLLALPYVLSILVLVRVYKDAQAPGALAKPYEREARL